MMDIDVQELKQKLDRGDDFLLLDVRTPHERDVAAIPTAVLLPMQELEPDHPVLEGWRDKEVVVFCHHGGRSSRMQDYLQSGGFSNVKNLSGGIHAWSTEIDPSVPTYD